MTQNNRNARGSSNQNYDIWDLKVWIPAFVTIFCLIINNFYNNSNMEKQFQNQASMIEKQSKINLNTLISEFEYKEKNDLLKKMIDLEAIYNSNAKNYSSLQLHYELYKIITEIQTKYKSDLVKCLTEKYLKEFNGEQKNNKYDTGKTISSSKVQSQYRKLRFGMQSELDYDKKKIVDTDTSKLKIDKKTCKK